MERRDYLELMTGQIRCKKMCPVIAKEVEDHIEDQKQAFMAEGMKEEEAEKAAVEEMGDPVEVGVEMDQIHRPKMPWKVIFVIALMQILSGMFAAFFLKQNESYGYIAGIRQIFRLAMAFSVMILVCYMDYSWIGKHARLLAGSYLLFMVLMRHFFALQINGAVRWIGVGGFSVSLSLMSWLFLPLYGAVLYRYRGEGYGAVLKAIVWMLLIAGILITCPDLVMAGTVGLSCVFMLMLALEKGWYQVAVTKVMTGIGISVVGVPVGILAYFFFFGAEYQKSRILAMFAVNKSQMMKGTTLGAVRELLSKCMAVGRATGVEDFWTGDRISSADYMMLGIAGYCDGSLYCNNCRFAVLVFKKRAEAEEPAWYDDGIWLCDGSGNSVSVITAGEHWGIQVRSGSLVSVLRIWTKWPDGFSSIDGNFAEYLPASECNS